LDDDKVTKPTGVLLPLAATLAAMAGFQGGAALAKGLFPAVGPEGAAALRLAFGAAILLGLARPWRSWPKGAPRLPLIGLGLSTAAAILGFYLAIQRLPLGVAVPLQFLGPLTVAVFGSRRASDLAWAALAAAGVWALVGAGQPAAGRIDPSGIPWALTAAAGWGGYIVFGRHAGQLYGRSTAALAIGIAALVVVPVGVAHAGAALFSPALIPLALGVALLSTVIPFSLELFALPRIPSRTFAVFTSLEPAMAVLSGLLLLGERLSPMQMAGVAVVIAAAAGAAWSSAAREATVADAPPN
jgi:inner membrane transporter RhtA